MNTEVSNRGTKVDQTSLDAAVDAWIALESEGSVSKAEVGRKLGLARAPEWLDSPAFLKRLDLARFTIEVNRLRGVKELVGLLDRVLDASLLEAYRRLTLSPEKIIDSVLFGEAFIKLVRLRHELAGSEGPKSPHNVWIDIRQEINSVSDPAMQKKISDMIFSQFEQGKLLLEAKSESTDGDMDVVDVQPLPEPVSEPNPVPTERKRNNDSDTLWTDPALD